MEWDINHLMIRIDVVLPEYGPKFLFDADEKTARVVHTLKHLHFCGNFILRFVESQYFANIKCCYSKISMYSTHMAFRRYFVKLNCSGNQVVLQYLFWCSKSRGIWAQFASSVNMVNNVCQMPVCHLNNQQNQRQKGQAKKKKRENDRFYVVMA